MKVDCCVRVCEDLLKLSRNLTLSIQYKLLLINASRGGEGSKIINFAPKFPLSILHLTLLPALIKYIIKK